MCAVLQRQQADNKQPALVPNLTGLSAFGGAQHGNLNKVGNNDHSRVVLGTGSRSVKPWVICEPDFPL